MNSHNDHLDMHHLRTKKKNLHTCASYHSIIINSFTLNAHKNYNKRRNISRIISIKRLNEKKKEKEEN